MEEERFFGARLVLYSVLILAVCGLFALLGGREDGKGENGLPASGKGRTAPTVILDPGHGGIDGGAVGIGGITEKDLNLAVAEELGRLLRAQGFLVVTTREDDTLPDGGRSGESRKMNDLKARLDVMIAHPDALFVSIHMNIYPDEKPWGTQIYYAAGQPESKKYADAIRGSVLTLQPGNRREAVGTEKGIYLLEHAPVPAVLIECGFLSNPGDAALLNDPVYRKTLAAYLCAGICAASAEPDV